MERTFRQAAREDLGLLIGMIKELADYEKLSDRVQLDEEVMARWMFERRTAEAIFVLEDGEEVGYALFFYNFSTFLGKAGIYLEDLFVRPQHRGKGHGKALLVELARRAKGEGCGRLEWSCLDWNKPSIDFYLSLNAQPLDEWTGYRLEGDSLLALAE